MDRQLWAHSRNTAGARHPLADHLQGTAALAGEFAAPFGGSEIASYLGLVHDVGKGACAWQAGLATAEEHGCRVGIDHKLAGTWLAERHLGPLAAAVYGHHGGLPDLGELKAALREVSNDEGIDRVAAIVPEIRPTTLPSWPAWFDGGRWTDQHVWDLFIRLVFSALVDADFLDTERHFLGALRPGHGQTAAGLVPRFDAAREAHVANAPASPVDALRQEVYEHAVSAAAGPAGVYRLAAPTGSGKTIASAAFALRHARAWGLDRVVVAVPFMSITEQNAGVYRRLLDGDGESPVVLEHHSGVDLSRLGPDQRWGRLAAENWDAPFVVTTTVQLFESLFDRRPSAMRKLHRLAGSVLVLDEVQALPDRLLLPILSTLRTLTECFGTTVLLASATQPAYWWLEPFRGLPVRDVIADPKPLYAALRRVHYEWWCDPRPTLEQVAKATADERQVLVVVNTTRDAARLHADLESRRDPALGPCLHLSTRMAAQHRRDVLVEIRERLAAGEPVAAVSTQLVEAGVDLDFPVVYRAFAPADSLQQAAGRANRNGHLASGRVVVFDPADGGQPPDRSYKAALDATRAHFGPSRAAPDDQDALGRYYPERYALQDLEGGGVGVSIQQARAAFDFREVAARFRLIEERTVPVVCAYGDEEDRKATTRLLDRLRAGAPGVADALRRLQPYIASLPVGLARRAEADGRAAPVIGDLREWLGDYHTKRGIVLGDTSDESRPEEFIW